MREHAKSGGIEALRQEDPVYMARWKEFVKEPLQDRRIQDDLEEIGKEPGHMHLAGDPKALLNEWLARQVEKQTPEQLATAPDNTWLGVMWRQFKDSAQLQAQDAGAPPLTDAQLRALAVRSREAQRRTGIT